LPVESTAKVTNFSYKMIWWTNFISAAADISAAAAIFLL
jgi:hypothetical protein